jgi:GT2 family glycosyltransferase
MSPNTQVSIVVCAYTEDRWDLIADAIKSLKAQTFQPLEIILVIDHNKKLYERVSAVFSDINVIENQGKRGLSGARNTGIKAAKGEILAFIDEDATASPTWLSNLVKAYSNKKVLGTGGLINPNWSDGIPRWFPTEFNWVVGCSHKGLPEKKAAIRNLIGCNMSFRKDVLEHVGGFRPEIGRIGTVPFGCEETELCIRATQSYPESKFIYEPAASVLHYVPAQRSNFHYFRSRCYAEGISKALITELIGEQDGLSSERTYTFKTLPSGVLRGIKDAFSGDFSGFGRAGAIIVGLMWTTWGFIVGKIVHVPQLRANKLESNRIRQMNGLKEK